MSNFCNSNYCCGCGNNFKNCCCETRCVIGPRGATGPTGPTGAIGPTGLTGATGPFLSSYIEAIGGTQNISSQSNIVFDTDPDDLDVVGTDITLDPDGYTFRFNRTGLYHIEWSLSLNSAIQPTIICLLENGNPTSPMKSELSTGNISSGALVNVDSLPFTISLNNYGGAINLLDPVGFENTVASIRILRFADSPVI